MKKTPERYTRCISFHVSESDETRLNEAVSAQRSKLGVSSYNRSDFLRDLVRSAVKVLEQQQE